jgi:NAD-dependent deacetylase
VVTPAADLPRVVKERGARLVIINRDPTPLDRLADATFAGSIGAVLTAIANVVGTLRVP